MEPKTPLFGYLDPPGWISSWIGSAFPWTIARLAGPSGGVFGSGFRVQGLGFRALTSLDAKLRQELGFHILLALCHPCLAIAC